VGAYGRNGVFMLSKTLKRAKRKRIIVFGFGQRYQTSAIDIYEWLHWKIAVKYTVRFRIGDSNHEA